MGTTEESKALMWRITDEIWNEGRLELIDELIADDLTDHVELVGLEGTGRARYRASIERSRARRSPTIGTLSISCWRELAHSPFHMGARQALIAANT